MYFQGLDVDGELPGGLRCGGGRRPFHAALQAERGLNLSAPHVVNDWISTYAMAVNEENAAGGQVGHRADQMARGRWSRR